LVLSQAANRGLVAEEALAAGNGEGHHHAVALLQAGDAPAGVFHDAHELVAEDVAGLHVGNLAAEDVQVGAADGRGGDAQHDIVVLLQHRVGHRLDADILRRLVGEGFHDGTFLESGRVVGARA
jgi:hypothetical protein